MDKFDEWGDEGSEYRKRQDREGKKLTARDIGARAVREQLAILLGEEVTELGGSHALTQFAEKKEEPKNETRRLKLSTGESSDDETDDDDDDETPAGGGDEGESTEDEMPPLEDNQAGGGELELEPNDGAEDYEAGGEEELELEVNDGTDDDSSLELEENTRPAAGTLL